MKKPSGMGTAARDREMEFVQETKADPGRRGSKNSRDGSRMGGRWPSLEPREEL
ncbi:MAG: hypothetical protein LBU15_03400 [Rickettsiales bacterium]|jgi:hypothetical protein|nr:hypothetical protein [Rickettsiales bacterium]